MRYLCPDRTRRVRVIIALSGAALVAFALVAWVICSGATVYV